MTADLTKRLPAETLNEIIAWVDEPKALHATAHVCQRWRHVAFDHPRRFCWPGCSYQTIPGICEKANPASLEPAFAKLKCRLDHSRAIALRLYRLETATSHALLKCLSKCLPRASSLQIIWDMEALTQPIFDALTSQPAPILSSLSLTWTTSASARRTKQMLTSRSRIPANILSGTSPALTSVYITGFDLPEAPLPQFSAVTSVSFDPGTPWDSNEPWPFQDVFVKHFPAMNSIILPNWSDVRLAAPRTPEGMLLMGRLTDLKISAQMLHPVLDDYAELSTIDSITVYPAYPPDARTLDSLLAHFAHDDFALDAGRVSGADPVWVVLSRNDVPRRRREVSASLAAFGGVFERARAAGHELRLVRATLHSDAFAALWPVLPPAHLRSFQLDIRTDAAGLPKTRPRVLPLLRDFVISREHRIALHGRAEQTTLRAGELSKFVRGALRVSGERTVTLRLDGVSVDRVTPAVQRMFAQVVQEPVSPGSICVVM